MPTLPSQLSTQQVRKNKSPIKPASFFGSPLNQQSLMDSNQIFNPASNQLITDLFPPITKNSLLDIKPLPISHLNHMSMFAQHQDAKSPHQSSVKKLKNRKHKGQKEKDQEMDDQNEFGPGRRYDVDPKHLPLGTEEEFNLRYPPNPHIESLKGLSVTTKGKAFSYGDHKAAQDLSMFSGQAKGNTHRIR